MLECGLGWLVLVLVGERQEIEKVVGVATMDKLLATIV
jgi:hypothetical protein